MRTTTILINSLVAAVSTMCLLPATAFADTIFSFSNIGSSGNVTGTGSSETLSLTVDSLTLNGTTTNFNSFTENYSNATGLLTFSGNGVGPFSNLTVAGSPFLSIQESTNLLGALPLNALNIYSGVTSLTFSPAFLSDLGLAGNPTPGQVTANVSVTTTGSGSVTSSVTTFDVASVPEPSTFTMLGMAMLLGAGVSAYRKFGPKQS